MSTTNQTNLNKYFFQGIRFIPGYNDFDHDDATIHAANEADAWKELNKNYKHRKGVALTHINDEPVKKAA